MPDIPDLGAVLEAQVAIRRLRDAVLRPDEPSPGRFMRANATAKNTVVFGDSGTAVPLPAIHDVYSGEKCLVAEQGAALTIIGPIDRGWTSYTPTWTNITVGGDATEFWRYRRVDGGWRVVGKLTWGSTSTLGSAVISFTLPSGVSTPTDLQGMPLGTAFHNDASSQAPDRGGVAWAVGASSVRINWGDDGNWNATGGGPGGNTLATGDVLGFNLFIPDLT